MPKKALEIPSLFLVYYCRPWFFISVQQSLILDVLKVEKKKKLSCRRDPPHRNWLWKKMSFPCPAVQVPLWSWSTPNLKPPKGPTTNKGCTQHLMGSHASFLGQVTKGQIDNNFLEWWHKVFCPFQNKTRTTKKITLCPFPHFTSQIYSKEYSSSPIVILLLIAPMIVH